MVRDARHYFITCFGDTRYGRMTEMKHEPPISVAKAAMDLGLSIHTIRSWIVQRRIAHVRLGRSIRIPASEIRRLLEAGLTPAQRP